MARLVKGCLTPQPDSAEEPETNASVHQQEEHRDAREGKVIADHDLDITMNQRGQTLTLTQLMKKRKTLMLNMEKLSYLKMEHCIRGQ